MSETSDIVFQVTLDEHHVPEKIHWRASDQNEEGDTNSLMVALWDEEEENTLRIDLWTKTMRVDHMKQFYHQCLLTMADSFERATAEAEAATELREFAQQFGKKLGLITDEE